ncbi:hypothetical protein P5770_16200 [Bacillus cereus]|uniref:hypothetical protein n=1 Tax=Bacillus cereus TaxID=1396 RepID=UPI0024058CB9|nr:hypothetical protein [Bacillus cereus]MDF9478248.1 hypothetical protein [Bacillus cereus]MDF9499867.1 hypothetical protein [Bacillus cereus]MDF9517501.1 hypothetical protein [Bacillus cereus]MDF9568956.1 hypothetical protein [Bacillus cereus]
MGYKSKSIIWLSFTLFTACSTLLFQLWNLVIPLFIAGFSLSIKTLIEEYLDTK